MTCGTFIFDDNFIFSDTSVGRKILLVLNDGEVGYYVVVKTTSKGTHKGITFGCQSNDRYPNFFLPKGCCFLKEDTWLGLDEFFEFTANEILTKVFSGHIRQLAVLPESILRDVLICAADCLDISKKQEQVVRETLLQFP
jgi:hypothetical protein